MAHVGTGVIDIEDPSQWCLENEQSNKVLFREVPAETVLLLVYLFKSYSKVYSPGREVPSRRGVDGLNPKTNGGCF